VYDNRRSFDDKFHAVEAVGMDDAAPTLIEECLALVSSSVFLCVVGGYAAQAATLIGVSTFGSAFLIGLGEFRRSRVDKLYSIIIMYTVR